ncbi:MAG: hypothetical protein JKY02_03350 [Flavobacteriaceae bacterium]|nr:hypothetical protein [Flavobacteriaceae bacterium]
MKTNVSLICLFLLVAQNFFGQSLSELVKEAEALFEKTRPHLKFTKVSSFNTSIHFYKEIDTFKNSNLLQTELKQLESQEYSKDLGFVFKANANYNFRNSFDEEINNFTTARIRAEVEWNILKSGFSYNRAKSKRLINEMKMLQNDQVQSERELMRRQFRIDYTYVINKETLLHFKNFLAFENEYFDFLNKLYYQKYSQREKLLKSSQQINVLKNQIEVLQKQNNLLRDSVSIKYKDVTYFPFLKLKIDSLSFHHSQENLELQKENIYLQHKAVNDLNFSFYVQESFNYFKNGYRFIPSVGIRFRAPIRFNHRKEIISTKVRILTAQNIDKSVGKYNRIITLTSGYNEKLKDVQNQYKSWGCIEERIRVLSVLKLELNNAETGVLLLGLLEEEFWVLENMLQLKRQLYTIVSHLFEVTEKKQLENLITPINLLETRTQKAFAIRINSKYSIDFQIAFLKAKGCTELEVLENDIETQKVLKSSKIPYRKVKKFKNELVELAIHNELNQLNEKS